jgi:hypothetical protein
MMQSSSIDANSKLAFPRHHLEENTENLLIAPLQKRQIQSTNVIKQPPDLQNKDEYEKEQVVDGFHPLS